MLCFGEVLSALPSAATEVSGNKALSPTEALALLIAGGNISLGSYYWDAYQQGTGQAKKFIGWVGQVSYAAGIYTLSYDWYQLQDLGAVGAAGTKGAQIVGTNRASGFVTQAAPGPVAGAGIPVILGMMGFAAWRRRAQQHA